MNRCGTKKKGVTPLMMALPQRFTAPFIVPNRPFFSRTFSCGSLTSAPSKNEQQNTEKPNTASIYSLCQIIRQDCQRIRQKTGKIIRQFTA
jgi:hypothetical protein